MAQINNTRFTLMAFPQYVDAGGYLYLNFLFIPRNFNPLEPVSTIYNNTGKTEAFVKARPNFSLQLVDNPDDFPGGNSNRGKTVLLNPEYPKSMEKIYRILKDAKDNNGKPLYFDIDESYSQSAEHRAPEAVDMNRAVKKYLPLSYRKAFNFKSPRNKNAVTDDSYACAMKSGAKPKEIIRDDKVSWGKVYAHLLRQPLLAEKAGLLYRNLKIKLTQTDFKNGGWLYIDLNAGDYFNEQQESDDATKDIFVKSYAARIPPLVFEDNKFTPRNLFAAVLFPVLKRGEIPKGNFDELFIESTSFMDGFSKIVHANQPVSYNILEEYPDGVPPQRELGIRLGWDDEQILIWYLRQLAKDPTVNGGTDRLDAPLGVSGYHIDVRTVNNSEIENKWESLNAVKSNGEMILGSDNLLFNLGQYEGELPYQVYPVKEENENNNGIYWLPMYFANWNSHSMVLPDYTAAKLYMNDEDENGNKVSLNETYKQATNINKLRYGSSYEFRIRMTDLTGGGPAIDKSPDKSVVSDIAKIHFKRYVAPHALRFSGGDKITISGDDEIFTGENLTIRRPLIGYPEVVYTGKYDDPIKLLKELTKDKSKSRNVIIGLDDPDVKKVEIKVEVETLMMDNLASESGQEHYITLYTTNRNFDAEFDSELKLDFQYKDYAALDFSVPFSSYETKINENKSPIILPTNRNLRVSLRAVGEGDGSYWGIVDENQKNLDSRYGKLTSIKMRKDSNEDFPLLKGTDDSLFLQGIFLQPDPILIPNGKFGTRSRLGNIPPILNRLADQINVSPGYTGDKLTLTAKKGERIQFWCSNQIRHTLSPDRSSVTFSGKGELTDKWLVVSNFYIDRDWTWDGLEKAAFKIERKRSTDGHPTDPSDRADYMEKKVYSSIGDFELERTASFQAIQEGNDKRIHREYTRIIIIDAVDNLPAKNKALDTILLQYRITPIFKKDIQTPDPTIESKCLLLPLTVKPHQTPKVIGSGFAFSPYVSNEAYSNTEIRRKYLWLEFEEAPEDDRDAIFTRQLAYAPDQLISNNHPSLFKNTDEEEPPLSLDPEYIRVIIPDTGQDRSGLSAMQPLIKSTDKDRHFYLLPLPEGLHSESPELFGFHTYEFRYGHTEKVWSTAQARFGRRLKLTGLQHPVPTLLCSVRRYSDKIQVQAPYAIAVANGKDVTAKPPRTQIWCLLYAQVKQADGKSFRNILLQDIRLNQIVENEDINIKGSSYQNYLKRLRDGKQPYAENSFQISDIQKSLKAYGLPSNSPLSVLCVEFYGHITNVIEHIDGLAVDPKLFNETKETTNTFLKNAGEYNDYNKRNNDKLFEGVPELTRYQKDRNFQPTKNHLGFFRILRTSPLTEVPSTCCVDC